MLKTCSAWSLTFSFFFFHCVLRLGKCVKKKRLGERVRCCLNNVKLWVTLMLLSVFFFSIPEYCLYMFLLNGGNDRIICKNCFKIWFWWTIFLSIEVAHILTRLICFFLAIHQKLEADGTEKVEGSMTQKLENVLNSEFVPLPRLAGAFITSCSAGLRGS